MRGSLMWLLIMVVVGSLAVLFFEDELPSHTVPTQSVGLQTAERRRQNDEPTQPVSLNGVSLRMSKSAALQRLKAIGYEPCSEVGNRITFKRVDELPPLHYEPGPQIFLGSGGHVKGVRCLGAPQLEVQGRSLGLAAQTTEVIDFLGEPDQRTADQWAYPSLGLTLWFQGSGLVRAELGDCSLEREKASHGGLGGPPHG